MMNEVATELNHAVERLWNATGNRNRVALASANGYVVFSSRGRHRSVVMHAAGGRNLPDGKKLSPARVKMLSDYGLRQRRASGDFQLEIKRDQVARLKPIISGIPNLLREVYETPRDEQKLTVRLETVPDIDSAEVEEAMNHLARQRDWAARKGLYMQMLRTQFVCAVSDERQLGSHMPLKPLTIGTIGPFPTVAIFTSYDALDHYAPVGLPARVISGMDVFPALLELKVGSVMVNPKGEPRGELYNNELHIIVDGIKRLGRAF